MKKWLSLAAALLLIGTLTGCGTDGTNGTNGTNGTAGVDGSDGTDGTDGTDAGTVTLKFDELSVPTTTTQKMSIRTSTSVEYENGNTDTIGFTKLISASTTNNGETFGLLKDSTDTAITYSDASPFICDGANGNALGSGLDHSSIIQQSGRIFMVSQFECEVGAMYGMELSQDSTTGELAVLDDSLTYISQKDGFGGWVHCAGVTTPWESHLGSEEYEPDARTVEEDLNTTTMLTGNSYYDEVTKYYWNDENNSNADANNNPYYYGYIPEVSIDASADTPVYSYTKHFSMGRAAWELAYVMPDERTVYMSDDGTNVGFFMYVADTTQDLSAGTLYAAKWVQTSAVGTDGGSADIEWIRLGHSDDATIKALVAAQPVFSDIFDTEDMNSSYECPTEGFTAVNTAMGAECLKVKTGQETAAAFLETRRYAAVLGATTEFRKEEGITYNAQDGILYVAMSEVKKGMEDGSSQDNGGNNDIRLAKNSCGVVYALEVAGASETPVDTDDTEIDSSYVVKNTQAEIIGKASSYAEGSDYEAYTCSINSIANPDNLTFLDGKNTLIIGEDTGKHPNDFVWSYDVKTKNLTRIVSTPYGSETTSPFWYEDINGFGYLSLVTQHPFGEVSSSDVDYSLSTEASATQKQSSVGVVGPFINW
ncbi:PhoX family protein [Sulfurimonas sp.]|uniref:PhoX family protein n=1 Tax=Sulfurimonas sp. TaxID=2022749 RepID=UPI003D0A5A1A